eukprot:SAG11_NODE_627_length_8087_cov_3.567852_8_plen_405_part_00
MNADISVCWYLDVWLDLEVSPEAAKKPGFDRKTPSRLHVQLLYESLDCPPIQEDVNNLMIEHDFARIAATLNGNMSSFNAAADRARLTWQFECMTLRAFSVLVDPTGDGEYISPARMWTVFKIMGEVLEPDELADLFGEALYGTDGAHTVDLLTCKMDVNAVRTALGQGERETPGPLKAGRRFRSAIEDQEVIDYLETEEVSSFLPEWALTAMERGDYEPLPPDRRNGHELWKMLRKKLENSLLIQKWTAMDSDMLDRSTDGNASESCLGKFFTRNPDGFLADLWNLVQIVLLVYVAFSVPMTIAYDLRDEPGSFGWTFEVFVDAFFVIDIFLNFRTQFEHQNGSIVTDSRAIALNYAKGWFIIYLVSCASISSYFINADSAVGARMGKTCGLFESKASASGKA